MFERFTAEAREAVVVAQTLARQGGGRSIDSRHLLLGLLEPGTGVAADALRSVGLDPAGFCVALRSEVRSGTLDAAALASVGIDLDAVRERADAVFGTGALERASRPPAKGHLPVTADAKKALELALREAIRLRSNRIDGAMLLLGLLRSTGSPAELLLRRALADAGSSPDQLRAAVESGEAQAS